MSPEKTHTQEQERKAINGPRPTPLRIQMDSKPMKKSSFSHSAKAGNSDRRPVIIYAHSPKIIHAKARDFRALVQSLTGLTRTEKLIENEEEKAAEVEHGNRIRSSSSMTTYGISSSSHQYLADMPLFTPNSTDLFFSPPSMCRYLDAVYFSPLPNMGSSMSPSSFAVKREFPKI